MGPATTLLSPGRLSELGAVGGSRGKSTLPPPLNFYDGDMVDRLYEGTMEDYYSTRTNDDNNAADHRDETASTSSIHVPDFVVLNPIRPTDDPLPQPGSSNILNLRPMEAVCLRRMDAMTTSSPRESTTAILARIEAEITISTNRGIQCEKWAITYEAKPQRRLMVPGARGRR